MALQEQTINVNFAQGVETKTDPFQIPSGKFASIVNSNFTTGGRLTKRNAFVALSQNISTAGTFTFKTFGSTITKGAAIAQYNQEQILLDGFGLYSYSDANSNWVFKGRAETVSLSSQSIVKGQFSQYQPDSAINGNLQLLTYFNQASGTGAPTGINISLVNLTNGNIILNNISVDTAGLYPKAVSVGSNLYVIYYKSGSLYYSLISETGAGTPTLIVNDPSSTNGPIYDVLVNNGTLYLAYEGTGNVILLKSYNGSFSLQHSATTTGNSQNSISLFADTSNNIWIPFSDNSSVNVMIYSATLASVLSPTVIDNGSSALNTNTVTGVYDGTQGIIFYDRIGTPNAGTGLALLSNNYVQPNPGATVTVTVASTAAFSVGTVVQILNGATDLIDYYIIQSIASNTSMTLINLNISGDASGVTVDAGTSFQGIANTPGAFIGHAEVSVLGTVTGPNNYLRSGVLASKAFLVNGIAHVNVLYPSGLQPTYFLTSLSNVWSLQNNVALVAGKYSDQIAGPITMKIGLPQVNLYNGQYEVALPRISSKFATTGLQFFQFNRFGVETVYFNFAPTEISTSQLANNLHIANASVLMYDGNNVVEHGFNVNPDIILVTTGSAGSIADGTYGYQVVYQWTDNQGQVHQSAPSVVVSVTLSTSNSGSAVLTTPTLNLTAKQNVIISVYRTLKNGSVYYRVDSGPGAVVYNSFGGPTTTFTDIYNDSAIVGNQQLYTTGQLANQVVPASFGLTTYKNREIALLSESPYVFWYSQQVVTTQNSLNSTPVEFCESFSENAGTLGGGLTAAVSMDDKLILFKSTTIDYLTGTGPAPSGANDDFTDPTLITTDTGCIDINSIVSMPLGIMFKSQKGIYLIDRSMSMQYIGSPVEQYNQYNVVDAKLIPTTNQVRMALNTNIVLVYDYFYGQWDSYSVPNTTVAGSFYEGYHTTLTAGGLVCQETPNSYVDSISSASTQPVTMSFTTGWINLAGLQGYQRAYCLYLLGSYISAHSLTVSFAYDYDSTIVHSETIAPNPAKPIEQWKCHFQRQTCSAFQLTVTENYIGTAGAGLTLSGFAIVAGIKKGYRPLGLTQSVG